MPSKSRISFAFAVLCLTTLPILAQTVKKAATAPANAHQRPVTNTTAKPKLTDAQIEQDIRTRLGRGKVAANHFQVRVQNGVAYLSGQASVIQHKGAATRSAKAAGAVKVVNEIQVSEAAKQKARDNLAKGRRREQVKRSEVTYRR